MVGNWREIGRKSVWNWWGIGGELAGGGSGLVGVGGILVGRW